MLPMILQCSKAPGSQPGQKVSQNIHELFRSCESPTACLPGSCKARKPILSFWSKVRIHWRRYKETTRWRCIRVLCLQPAIHVALHTWARTRSPMRRIPAYLLWQSSVCICIPFSSMLEGTDSFHSQTLTGENIPTVGLFVFSLSIWLQPFPFLLSLLKRSLCSPCCQTRPLCTTPWLFWIWSWYHSPGEHCRTFLCNSTLVLLV